ncbi:MAG: response regulator [Clostridia bacterium]|nr:response regulator [Clostridia bacterium]
MLLKVLIVDDDSIARTNIKTMLDWGKNGFEICGEAANGSSAVQCIDNDPPHIVITDMSMPVMDGVALIEYLEKNHPEIKAIALSGYDDFAYVRQSMKKGAVDYILKHTLDAGVLLSALKAAEGLILRNQQENARKSMLQEQLTESREVVKQNFIRQLVQGAVNEKSEIEQKITSLSLDMDTRNLALVVAEIDDFHFIQEKFSVKETNKLISSIMDISTEVLKDSGKAIISHLEGGKFVIIFSFGNMRSDLFIYNLIVTAVDRIKISIKRYLNITACFSLSKIFNDISEISACYKEAELALQDRFFSGKDKIIKEPSQVHIQNEYFNLDINDEKNIITALKAIDLRKLNECVDMIFTKIIDRKASYKSIQMICAELINIINRVARESGIDVKMVYSDNEIPYEAMKKFETIAEVKQWILDVYEKLIRYIELSKINPDYTEPTKKAIAFIQKNYAKNISLNETAEFIGVNSSYLSRVFKEDCGKGFVEYLNMVRVEHAKRLIEKGRIKLKDVVREVGFNSYTYFFKVFKDSLNMTPLEYEESCMNKHK